MPDTADKSDDLIAELAKLMASGSQGSAPAVAPIPRPAPLSATPLPAAPTSASPSPAPVIRIPGMDAPPAAPLPPPVEPRAPATGTIRIPGMDQPAPVTTSAPVSRFDFGKPPAAPEIKQEPLSSIADRIASQAASAAQIAPVTPPVSFASIPTPSATPPKPSTDSGFNFDFGLNGNQPQPQKPANDPIADLIAAELEADPSPTPSPGLPPREARPVDAVVTPIIRVAQPSQATTAVPNKPTLSPMAAAVAARPTNSAPVPLKPVTAPPRAPESDRFAISPGIGLNGRPASGQPLNTPVVREPEPEFSTDDSDPMTEIENLIGEAVRVELSAPGPVKVQAAAATSLGPDDFQPIPPPVVPPLTTGFAPRRSDLKDADHSDAAEEAILAAAAASGAELGRLEGAPEADSPYRRLKVKPAQSGFMSGGMRQYVGMAVAGTLLLVAGLGLYWVLNMGRGDAEPPTLAADTTQVKAPAPSAEPTATTETTSPVLAEMGGTSAQPSAEVLVSTDQTNGQNSVRDVAAAPPDAATTTGEDAEGALANRKVRTVTVRPDGTIVSSDDAVAGTEVLPVDRPTSLPDLPMDNTVDILNPPATTIAATTESDPIASTIDATAGTPDTALGTGTSTLVASIDPTKVAPTPAPPPNRAAMVYAPPQQQAGPVTAIVDQPADSGLDLLASNDAPAPAAAAPTSAGSAAAYVQLASSLTEAEANGAIAQANARFGNLFGGNQLIVQRADLGAKGIRYRVRLPLSSLAEAQRICGEIKASGGDCFATLS